MEFKTDALVLRAADYGENDRMVTLFTAARGKLGAAMKGVRKAGAKLRFAAQPFCFAEYVLASRGGRYTVVSASLHDGFYPLREDVSALYAASSVCEVCDRLLYEGMEGEALLLSAVRALTALCEGEGSPALVRFLLAALAFAGYPVRAGACPVCGGEPAGRMTFDMEGGAFACRDCAEGVPASEVTYRAVRAVASGGRAEGEGAVRALRLLKAYFAHKTECDLPALTQYLELPA